MQAQYFPVQLDHMGATFEFLHIAKASEHFTGVNNTVTKVTANRHNHPGGAYGYRVERAGKVLVFCTDIEHGTALTRGWLSWRVGRTYWCTRPSTPRRNSKSKRAGDTAVMSKRSRWRDGWREASGAYPP